LPRRRQAENFIDSDPKIIGTQVAEGPYARGSPERTPPQVRVPSTEFMTFLLALKVVLKVGTHNRRSNPGFTKE
jgi:hypothetical protein